MLTREGLDAAVSDAAPGLDALAREAARRRTFAIISHPDAGKTTLTERLLLYGGVIHLAGSVRGRKTRRHATSDWMAIEQARGISVTSTVLQFEYGGRCVNLLDTPGHEDFSEDTYRTLVAADSAVMVLDGAKGVEARTRKLFEVCRMRRIPVLTFINKLDLPGRHPLDLLDEIEQMLGIDPAPLNWPIGDGPRFLGVYDLARGQVLRFERTLHGERRAPAAVADLGDLRSATALGEPAYRRLREELDLLQAAANGFDMESFLAGRLTPVFFGSAVNNFGVEPFLDALVALAPPPGARPSDRGPVEPVRIDRAAGEVQQGGLPRRDELVDLLDGARLGDAGAGAEPGPEHAHQDVAATDELAVDGLLRSDP